MSSGPWIREVTTVAEVLKGQDHETKALQALIDNGQAWQLEGSIGRMAIAAIRGGWCLLGPVGFTDHYGDYFPSRDEIAPGRPGTVEYVNQMRQLP